MVTVFSPSAKRGEVESRLCRKNSTSVERIFKAENSRTLNKFRKAKNFHTLDVFEHFFKIFKKEHSSF
jgi:hypothetical protein